MNDEQANPHENTGTQRSPCLLQVVPKPQRSTASNTVYWWYRGPWYRAYTGKPWRV
ncbi:hypothetical protein CY34DRAFT_812833 [Suillus luteus UH-Slu-Lm8-n1]|uniref:Uncharacterized protein n=1 Tax=Suillus luteus UH-Slu-Lm8-n1 TaxID=930992 RepID=A0A0C9ZYL3_9AGAM|nr:hypothetical protein CY34DRAFT_812833 [Suillus luteus UH-Slu-Lm8-n1]